MKIWAYVALAITAIGGFLTFMFTMKKAGRDAAEADQMEETLDAVKEKNALDRELDDSDARDELREEHYRD